MGNVKHDAGGGGAARGAGAAGGAAQPGVRSYVVRAGRTTPAQARALQALWPRWGLEPSGPLDLDATFGRRAPRVLEIGFGNGEALAALAAVNPGTDFLGIEVHPPGIGRLLAELARRELDNVRLLRGDAVALLECCIPPASLARVNIWFPDPWPKKRHHKRRLVQAPFLELVAARLAPGGLLHLATDWAPYAEHMEAALAAVPGLRAPGAAEARAVASERPRTHFQARGEARGHGVRDLVCRRAGP
jgi:tRNA (guanine-N7-)-methyltransferase